MPASIRTLGLRFLPWESVQRSIGAERFPLSPMADPEPGSAAGRFKLGVVGTFGGFHRAAENACREMGVPHEVVDISGPDWIDVVRESACDAFLVRPPCLVRLWKDRLDERLRIMANELRATLCPTLDEIWLYESKRRQLYWLEANGVPHARTWVFYSEQRALEFARHAELPIVFKSDFGSKTSGVRILRSRSELARLVKRCFRRGFRSDKAHPMERQWGHVLLQEYVPEAREWRAIRMGRSYFALEKRRRGEFHSGSNDWVLDDPPVSVIDFTRELTERAGFRSMNLDVLETLDGRHLVSEMHTVFQSPTPFKTRVNGVDGRYLYDENEGEWTFDPGVFFHNAGWNLRVEYLLDRLEAGSRGGGSGENGEPREEFAPLGEACLEARG